MSKCVCTHRRRDHEGELPQPCWVVDCACLGFYDVELLPVSTIPAYTEPPRLPWLDEIAVWENTMSNKTKPCLCGHSIYDHVAWAEACYTCDCLWYTPMDDFDDLEDEETWFLDEDEEDEAFCDYIEGNHDEDYENSLSGDDDDLG